MALKAGRVGVRPDQVDKQGYITGGGGGGGDVFEMVVDTILEPTAATASAVVDLTKDFNDYKLLIISASYPAGSIKALLSATYNTEEITAGDMIGVSFLNLYHVWLAIEEDKVTISEVTLPAGGKVAIYGVKVDKKEE